MEYFERLGLLTDLLWKEKGYHEECFPEVAVSALEELPPGEHIRIMDLIRWVHTTPQFPEQAYIHARFGKPRLTLFNNRRFFIDINFWLDGSTSIHDHGFAGAFSVLEGSSLHSRFEFNIEKSYSRQLLQGTMKMLEAQSLCRGDTLPIYPGNRLIHSLFHLDRPSATVVIRTDTPWHSPQYEYWWPYFAVASQDKLPHQLIRKIELVELLLNQSHPGLHRLLMETLPNEDPLSLVYLLEKARSGYSGKLEELAELFDLTKSRNPALIHALFASFKHRSQASEIVRWRARFHDPEMRFLLALLLNLHHPDHLLSMMAHRYPDRDPMKTTMEQILFLACHLKEEFGEHPSSLHLKVLHEVLDGLNWTHVLAPDFAVPEGPRQIGKKPRGPGEGVGHNPKVAASPITV